MPGSGRVPRVRARGRRTLRHLGWHERAGAAQAQTAGLLARSDSSARGVTGYYAWASGAVDRASPPNELILYMSFTDAVAPPRLGVVLVVHNGLRWLPVILGTMGEWRIAGLELIVVDNGSTDGSRELLESRVTSDRLIHLDNARSFSEAVEVALRHPALDGVPVLLLMHDDLVMTVDAVSTLLATMEADPEIAIAGPKLRDWSQEPIVQQVGQTTDPFGRWISDLEPGEMDQGQHDEANDTLFVSTAGMIVRTGAYEELGGFDRRMSFQREDFDLCWRAWIAGYRVRVVPMAIGYHVAAGERGGRPLGGDRSYQVSYLTERHTLAALLKNYSMARLALLLPIGMVLFLVRALGLLMTRRVGIAVAGLRAVGWNFAHLPSTLLLRRRTQRLRRRTDSDLRPLFASPYARLREYFEAAGTWISGSRTPRLLDDSTAAPVGASQPRTLGAFLRRHPVMIVGPILLALYLVGTMRLLGGGQIVGGQVMPSPQAATDFLRSYVSPWRGDPLGSSAFASPAQIVFGLASYAGLGSQWLAQRLLVLGLPVVAFLLTIRAGRLLSTRMWPRLLGATVYTLSPPVLGALARGRISELLLAALLPGLVVLLVWSADYRRTPSEGWRAAALMALTLAIAWAVAPGAWMVPAGVWFSGVVVAATLPQRRGALLRTFVAAPLALLVLSPWLVDAIRTSSQVIESAPFEPVQAWRAFLVAPDLLEGLLPVGGLIAILATPGVVGAALLLTGRGRATAVVVLLTVITLWGLATWATGHFGLRQVLAAGCAVVLVTGLGASMARLVTDPWSQLRTAKDLVPAFVAADGSRVGPYRILLLDGGKETVTWEVTDNTGPSMLEFGTTPSDALTRGLSEAVAAIGLGDPRGASDLGLLNVRYVVIHDRATSGELVRLLAAQPDLEPFASGAGQ